MAIDEGELGTFGSLGTAIGLFNASGTNSAWFEQPMGGGGNPAGLSTVLSNPEQRDALLTFVDEILGPPAGRTDGAKRWIPLFQNVDPTVTIYAVVEALAGSVRLGVGVEHTTGVGAPLVASRLHVPLIHVPNGATDARPGGGGDPDWLLIGHAGGIIDVEIDATFTDSAPVPGESYLRGASVRIGIPTSAEDDLGFGLELVDLQIPGATTPSTQTLDVDSLATIGGDVFEFLVGLVRAQTAVLDMDDEAFRHFAGLAGVLGLREVADIPPLPLADIPTAGPAVLVAWVEQLLADGDARDAWLAELARLVGGTAQLARDAVTLTLGDVAITLGLRVTPGAAGHPVLVPWAEVGYATRQGVSVGGGIDLMRIDTATGSVRAVPQVRVEAVFGADATAGASRLVATGPVEIGSVHVGVRLDDLARPAFALTLHDVDISAGGVPRHHELLDLSSPDAALDAVDDVIDDALGSALDALGQAGQLVKQLLGIEPPAGVNEISIVDIVTDPLNTIRAYYAELIGDADAMREVLATLQGLLTGVTGGVVTGTGSLVEPWRVVLAAAGGAGGLGLTVWVTDGHVVVAAAADLATPTFGGLTVAADLRMVLLDADLTRGQVALAPGGSARLLLQPGGAGPATVSVGVADLEFAGAGVEVGWRAGTGLTFGVVGDGLTVIVSDIEGSGPGGLAVADAPIRLALALPAVGPGGTITWAPDWDDVEVLLGRLLGEARVPIVDALLDLVGWVPSTGIQRSGAGQARLSLSALIADPAAAITVWAVDLALDCDHLHAALGVLTSVLSGMSMRAPVGLGRVDLPYRSPIAGVLAAPAVVAWTEPPCPPSPATLIGGPLGLLDGIHVGAQGDLDDALPVGADLLAALAQATPAVPGLDDLLFARSGLGGGFDQLVARWTGTDGVTGPTSSLPTGVTSTVLTGYGYAELAAFGRSATDLLAGLTTATTAVAHVGCGSDWGAGYPAGEIVDATGGTTGAAAPAGGLDAAANGRWFVRLADPAAAAAQRSDHDAVAAQAARLGELLAARTAPIVLVAYGAAGAAAIRVAAAAAQVSAVVTVGTPWSPVSVTSMQTGPGGDAAAFLSGLLPAGTAAAAWPDELLAVQASPLARGVDLVRRAISVTGPGVLPSAGSEALRPGLEVHAVFGVLSGTDATAALVSVVTQAIVDRSEAAVAETALASSSRPERLHVGIDLPALDADIGGLTIGAGVRLDLAQVGRAVPPATAPALAAAREVIVTVRIGVTDGWLVGGPGAASRELEVRWVEARVHVPLALRGQPAGQGFTELVLHDARAFAASRERWVVRADGLTALAADALSATTALPEVKILLGEVIGRVRADAAPVGAVLEALGLVRAGGLDTDALDRVLFDPGATLRPLIAAAPATLAAAVNVLTGAPPDPARAPTAIDLGTDEARVRIDLASRTVAGTADVSIVGMPRIQLSLSAGPSNATFEAVAGDLDPHLGGVGLRFAAATGSGVALSVQHRPPAQASQPVPTLAIPLLPDPDVTGLTRLAATVLPAALLQALATSVRTTSSAAGRATLDAALDAVGLLTAAAENGTRLVRLPVGLLTDPRNWLLQRSDPLAAAVAVLDALAPIVAPGRGAAPGWPIDPAFGVTYSIVGGRLELVAHVTLAETLDGATIEVDIAAGLAIATTAAPQPIVDAAITVDGWGLRLRSRPGLTLDLLRPDPSPAIALFPAGAGLGSTIADVGTSLLPPALNALAAHRADASPSLVKDVGAAVYEIGDAMGLMEGATGARTFTVARIDGFAANPSGALLARLPALASAGLAALADALDPTGMLVTSSALSSTVRRFEFGTSGSIHVDFDGAPGMPAIDIGGSFELRGDGAAFGEIAIEHLRLTSTGVQVEVRVGPVQVDLGSMVLRPIVVVRAGVTGGTFTRLVGIGLGLDDDGDQSVEFRWSLDASPPSLAAVTRTPTGETADTDVGRVAIQLVGIAVSLASGILTEQLGAVITDDATARLQGVVFAGGDRTIDPTLVADLLAPDRLLARLMTLAWNCAVGPNPLSLTIDGTVTLALAGIADGPDRRIGLAVTLVPNTSFPIATGDVNVELEVDAAWVEPAVPAGLAVYVLKGPSADDLGLDFGVSIAGIGLRFTKTAGPLVELGAISLDGLAVHLYGEASSSGAGGGARLQLSGLAVAPGGGGEGNAMANSLVNDAGAAGANNRPSFSPSLSIQQHPTTPLAVGLRAGDPPGPWWIVVQRQLGPLYVERIGLDTVEQGGRVTRISFLFSGSVSLFGLTAAVDQLSLNWEGGDVLSISSWSADLMGLAVSAEMSGVSLAGGLLKSVDPAGVTSYVGMLVGRFATYGLSVYGGYASDDAGHASFFVFGAVTGPIGGPPAFFLTGLGGGLGINRGLVIPTDLNEFPTYPFIQALDPAASAPPNPMDKLRELNEFFPHSPGNFWFAAGISFNSFALVDGVAVVAVAFGDGLEINLLGLARMALPRPGVELVSIELALLARFSTVEGVFMIKAQLTDNSWLLYEDIRLTGGFAFALWWKGPLAGQFVLTMGGYHPDFHRDGYPDVPRLGLVWKISDAIEMKGETYFALTSEALMAGTATSVSVDFGWVWAKITFGADGIVYFDPFFFDVKAYCRISAGIDIDLGLFSISLSISIGASIHVWGPDFAGEVVFEIGPCEVPIRFGPQAQQPGRTLGWGEFVTKYLEDAGGGTARALSGITGKGTLPTSTKGGQSAPSADGSAALPFRVFAEFDISFTTVVPTTSFTVGGTRKDIPLTLSNGAGTMLGLAPMGAGQLTSGVVIALKKQDEQTSAWLASADISKLAANLVAGSPDPEGSRFTTDAFPTGVWGEPKSLTAAVKPVPSGDVLVTGNRVVLVAGVGTKTAGPEIVYRQVTTDVRRPLPLRAAGSLRTDLLQAAGAVDVHHATTAGDALASARLTLFVSPTGLAAAAYEFDRVAPPRFANLADGLATVNGTGGQREAPPTTPSAPAVTVRAPFVAGYLASGIGAAARATATSVSDRRIKRRAAPTTDSVRGRLGAHIPAALHRTAPPAVARNGTLVSALSVPRTDVLGAVRSTLAGPVGRIGVNAVVGGLGGVGEVGVSPAGPLADADRPERIGTGDVVTLQSPDARIDVSDVRPAVGVTGRARVVMLAAHGVVHDDDAVDATVDVPVGTSLIAVQADGDADALDGFSGWHDRSRVALMATRAAIGAGCTITVDGHGASLAPGWANAGSLTLRAAEINTRFSRTMRTVAVALTGVTPRTLDQTRIHLIGAGVTRDRSGAELPPTVVTLGQTTVVVYPVTPDRGARCLTVAITPGADWAVVGVLGGGGPNEPAISAAAMAEQIARGGLASVTAQLTVMQGPGCRVDWVSPDSPHTPRASTPRRAPAKPASKRTTKTAAEPATKPASQRTAKPVSTRTATPATKPASTRTAKPATKPATKRGSAKREFTMTVGEGKFLLYSHITPALKAGDYRFEVSQQLAATKGSDALDAGDLPVDTLHTHVSVTAPRYQLPPDQVLSTYPPAGSVGAYGRRLPQIVIKRRTLPWERGLTMPDSAGGQVAVSENTPWLALVVIAEGEAELRLNQDVAKCVSPGVTLGGEADVAKGNCLVVRQSVLEKVLPTRKDVPLLAHAREVDINDTELMMGDDDGYLSVVIANRLPVAGADASGKPTPVKYLVCLINLEGQFHRLIPESPPWSRFTNLFGELHNVYVQDATYDHVVSGGMVEHWADPVINPSGDFGALAGLAGVARAGGPRAEGPAPLADDGLQALTTITSIGSGTSAYAGSTGYTSAPFDVYAHMATDFAHASILLAEPEFTFPVLIHWSFTSSGNVDFEALMKGLDSGLLGTVPAVEQDQTGRAPLEVVETGHVGLTHRTRRGDVTRAWYRGPLLPHPASGERLPLAHAADQLRAVIPDRREDISLAAAFEIGRLLALSRPAMVAALLRWRQTQFQLARSGAIWGGIKDHLPFDDLVVDGDIRRVLEGKLRELVTAQPDELIGPPRVLVGPGDPVDWGDTPLELLGRGLGIDFDLAGGLRTFDDLATVAVNLRDMPPPVADFGNLDGRFDNVVLRDALNGVLDGSVERLTSDVLANEIAVDPTLGTTVLRTPDIGTVSGPVAGGLLDIPGGVVNVVGAGPGGGGRGPVLGGGLGVPIPRADAPDPPPSPRSRRAPSRRAPSPDALDELLGARRRRPSSRQEQRP